MFRMEQKETIKLNNRYGNSMDQQFPHEETWVVLGS